MNATASGPPRGRMAWTIYAVSMAGILALDLLVMWQWRTGQTFKYAYWLESTVGSASYGLVGAFIVARVAGNRLGPLMLAVPAISLAQGFGGALALTGAALGWPSVVVAILGGVFAAAQILTVGTLLLLLFLAPDGQPFNRFLRLTVRAFVLVVVLLIPAQFLAGPIGKGSSPSDNPLPGYPVGLTIVSPAITHIAQAFSNALGVFALLTVPVAMTALIHRWLQSDADARRRSGWAIAGALAAPLVIIVGSVIGIPTIYGGDPTWALALSMLPLGIAIGVLRLGLYDLDRVVSRTVSYAIVTGLVLATYAVIVISVSRVLGETSPVAVAGATLAAAAIARPLLTRVRRVVDRRFNRERVDGQLAVEAFGARLADEVDPDRAVDDLVDLTRRTLAPASVSLWTAPR
jgi:hypothetical protein